MTAWGLEAINKVQGTGVSKCRRRWEGDPRPASGGRPGYVLCRSSEWTRWQPKQSWWSQWTGWVHWHVSSLLRNSSRRMNCDPQSYRPHSAPSGPPPNSPCHPVIGRRPGIPPCPAEVHGANLHGAARRGPRTWTMGTRLLNSADAGRGARLLGAWATQPGWMNRSPTFSGCSPHLPSPTTPQHWTAWQPARGEGRPHIQIPGNNHYANGSNTISTAIAPFRRHHPSPERAPADPGFLRHVLNARSSRWPSTDHATDRPSPQNMQKIRPLN